MQCVIITSSVFEVLVFTHKGKLVIVEQLTYTQKGHLDTTDSTIALIDQPHLTNESFGVGMYTLLMCTFDIPTPINYLGSMSVGKNIYMVVDRTNPWVLASREEPQVPLSTS